MIGARIAVVVSLLHFGLEPGTVDEIVPDCGKCAVYAFLKLHGQSVKLTEIMQQCESDPERGMSIADVRSAIARHGEPTVAVKFRPNDLARLPLPAVLYIRPGRWDARFPSRGHFITIAYCEKGVFRGFDWSRQDSEFAVTEKVLHQCWEGDAIVSQDSLPRPFSWREFVLPAVTAVLFLCFPTKKLAPVAAVCMLLTCFASGCNKTDVPKNAPPPLTLTKEFFDLGDVSPERYAEVELEFTVNPKFSVKVTGIPRSCACTAVDTDLIGQELAPGSIHKIGVHIHVGEEPTTTYQRQVQLLTDPPSQHPQIATVRYRGQGPPIFPKVVRGECHYNERAVVEFTTAFKRAIHEKTAWLLRDECRFPGFEVVDVTERTEEVEATADGVQMAVDLTKIQLRSSQPFLAAKTILCEMAFVDHPARPMTLEVAVPHPFSPLQTLSFLGEVRAGASWNAGLRLRQPIESWEIERFECPPGISAELKDSSVRINGTAPANIGRFKESVVVRFPRDKYPPVTLSVSGIVK